MQECILIVDDDANLRKTLSNILGAKGYTPIIAATGKIALDRVLEQTPVVALIDLRLEDMSGLKVLAEIKERSPNTECIVLTGYASQTSAIEAVNLGAYSYLQKPYDPDQLLLTIRRAIEKRQAEQALQENQRRLSNLMANLPGMAYRCQNDPDFTIEFVSQGCLDLTGYQPADLVGNHKIACAELIHPNDREQVWQNVQTAVREREPFQLLYRIKTTKGEEKWVWEQGNGVFSDQGELLALEGFIINITERVRAEKERERLIAQVQEQAQRLQQTVDTVPEGVLLLDADRRIILANPVAERELGALSDAKAGDVLTHLGGCPLVELLTSPPKGLWHEVTADGRCFETIARPLETGPEPKGWVLVIRDVTQEREIQQRIQQQDRLAAVGQLAAGIAHDFNNIMAVIVLYAETVLRITPDLPSTSENRLKTVIQQAKHAGELIQQILDFSRRAVIEQQPLNLVPLLKEQVKLLERTLPENIRVHLALVKETDECTVNADPTRIRQMVMNLALNARDAIPPRDDGELCIGLERLRIEHDRDSPLHEIHTGEWVRVTVSDNGTGIAPDVLPHIFDPFFTTKAPGRGNGLGLAQVYGIVKQHEGEIDVRSRPGRGTTFDIYLPALAIDPPEATTVATQVLERGTGETILVVEDDAATRVALMDTLETLNYRSLGAASGREAQRILERHWHEIALVLSDVVMPEMGGIALFQSLRQQYPNMPMVLLTGHPLEKELEGLRNQGLKDWLPKPPDLERLAQAVARGLGKDA